MKIVCPKCSSSYDIDDNRIPPAGLVMKCPSCLHSFPVRREAPPPPPQGGFDLEGPDPFAAQADLPAPRGYAAAAPGVVGTPDLPVPKRAPGPAGTVQGYQPSPPRPPPQPPAFTLGEVDLPTPARGDTPFAPPAGPAFEMEPMDLQPAAQARGSGDASYGELDFGPDTDLPAPSAGLPAPSHNIGLPAPSAGIGLPAPSPGIALPGPRFAGAAPQLPDLSFDEPMAGPAPSAAQDLDPFHLDDLPPPEESGPGPGAQRLHIDLDAVDQRPEDVPDMDVSAPAGPDEGGGLEALEGEAQGGKKKKKDKGKKKEKARQKEKDEPAARQGSARSGVAARGHAPRLSSRALAIGGAVLAAMLIVGGVGAWIWLGHGPTSVPDRLQREVTQTIQSDLFPSYQDAAKKVHARVQQEANNPDLLAFEAQILAMAGVIHGDSGALLKDVDALLAKYPEPKEPSPWLLKARAWRAALAGKDASKLFQVTFRARANDPLVTLGVGWSALALGKHKEAEEAFRKLLAADAGRVAARHGLARVLEARGDLIAARDEHVKILQVSNAHFAANLAVARGKASTGPSLSDEIQKVLQQYGKMASPSELAAAWCTIGDSALADGKSDEADTSYKQAATFDPGSTRASNGLAAALLAQDRITEALGKLIEAKKSERADATTHILLAQASLATGRPTEARAEIQVAKEQAPRDPRVPLWLGRIERSTEGPGATDKAVAAFQAGIQLDPRCVDNYVDLADLYAHVGKREQALATLKQADEQVPDNVEVAIERGELALFFKEPATARKEFEGALAKAPTVNRARHGLARALEALNELEMARIEYEKILQTAKAYAGVAERLGRIYMTLGRRDRAEQIFDVEFKRNEHPAASLRYEGGQVYFELERYEKVLPLLESILSEEQRRDDVYHLKCKTLHRMGRFDDAIRACKRAQSIRPLAIYYQEAGLVFISMGSPEEAKKELELAIEKDGSLYEARIHYALLLVKIRRMSDAIRQLEAAEKAAGPKPLIYKAKGKAFKELDKKPEAIAAFTKAVKGDPADAESHFLLAELYEVTNQFAPALRELQAAERCKIIPKDISLSIHFKLAALYEHANSRALACQHYKAFLASAPDNDAIRPDAAAHARILECK